MFGKKSFIILASIIIFVILIYLILSVYITTIAIKATRKIPDATPARVSLNYSVEEFFTEDSIRLSGWFVKNESLDTVVMIHGVDSNKSDGYMLDLMKLHESIEEIPSTNKPMISHDARTASESRFSFSTPIKKRSGRRCRVGDLSTLRCGTN